MKKEGLGRYVLPAAAVGVSLLGVEIVRETYSMQQVKYMPALAECIDNRSVYGLESYDSARRECIAEAGLPAESTPVIKFLLSTLTGYQDK